jgi:hypothetical protein
MLLITMESSPPNQPDDGTKVTELPTPVPALKHRPTHSLPSNRVAFQKQLAILRGYAAASGPDRNPVGLTTLGEIVEMAPTTVSLMNSFFADIGLIEKAGAGYAPVAAVLNFGRVYRWDQENAGPELASVIRSTWFAEALLPRLTYGPMDEDRALTVLANEANADVDYRPKVRILLSYLETAGLIAIEGTQVSALEAATVSPAPAETPPRTEERPTPSPESAKVHVPVSGPLPLLIQGLLEQLPSDGTWTRGQARTWLQMAALAFDVVYDLGPDDGVPLAPADGGISE